MICIENKIDSSEHSNQLLRYQNFIECTYPTYKKMYLYLTPDGSDASLSDVWLSISYSDVIQIIEKACKKTKLLPEAELLIRNYLEIIRRDIVGDEHLARICAEIYSKHKRALDLIYENKPDKASDVAEIFRKWALLKTKAGELQFAHDKSSKTYTRFTTPAMSRILPDADEATSGWSTKNYYFYEIKNINGEEFYVHLSLSSKNIPDKLRNICEEINKHAPASHKKENWQWRIPFSTKKSKIDQDTSEEKIFELLDKKLENIKSFESDLESKLFKE